MKLREKVIKRMKLSNIEMPTEEQFVGAMKRIHPDQPSGNHTRTSQIPWCLLKSALGMIYKGIRKQNGKMFGGTVFHEYVFPKLVNAIYPPISIKEKIIRWLDMSNNPIIRKLFKRMRFERELSYHTNGGEKDLVTGHCDFWSPEYDLVIEFKTTQSPRPLARGDPMTERYVMQGNSYGGILKAKHWQIWKLYLNFEDINMSPFFTLSGDTNVELFEEYKKRVDLVYEIYERLVHFSYIDLESLGDFPEQLFECNNCEQFLNCPMHKKNIAHIEDILPNSVGVLIGETIESENTRLSMAATFEAMKKQKLVWWDRNSRLWRDKDD